MITGHLSGIQSVGVTEDNTHKEVINVMFFGARKVWQKFGQHCQEQDQTLCKLWELQA
jgi:hypothetical protein